MTSKLPPLSTTERICSILLGGLSVIVAGWLFFHPPKRLSETTETSREPTKVTRTEEGPDPSAEVVTLATVGAAFLLFGINGVKFLKFSTPMGEIESGEVETTVRPPKEEPLVNAINEVAGPAEAVPPIPPAVDVGKSIYEMLVTPYLPTESRPAIPLAPVIPESERAPKPGVKITIDQAGLRNAASVYFFSHDLMLCEAALLTGAHKNYVVHTLNCALDHLAKIGFGRTPFQVQLTQIAVECHEMPEQGFPPDRRSALAAEVFRLSRAVGDIIFQLNQRT